MPTRTDWLLRFIAGADGDDGDLDRIHIMKGMFLFQEEHSPPSEVNYRFRPYDYGPFTSEIYDDLTALKAEGHLRAFEDGFAPGRERYYRVSASGREYLQRVAFDDEHEQVVLSVRREISGLNFHDLLKRVYRAHPASAARSIARGILD